MVDLSNIERTRERIAELGWLIFERKLTDVSGGNLSARVGELICITPRFAGQQRLWNLRPEDVLVVDQQGIVLDGEGEITREAKAHLRVYHTFPMANGVAHCHPRHVLIFCAGRRPIPPVLEAVRRFGVIQVTPEYAPAHSDRLAEMICQCLAGQEDRIRKQAALILARWHGIFAVGKNLEAAVDAVERVDVNASILIDSAHSLEEAVELGYLWSAELEAEISGKE